MVACVCARLFTGVFGALIELVLSLACRDNFIRLLTGKKLHGDLLQEKTTKNVW